MTASSEQIIIKLKAHASSLESVGSVVWRQKYRDDCVAVLLEAAERITELEAEIQSLTENYLASI